MLNFKTTAIILCTLTLLLSMSLSVLALSRNETTTTPDVSPTGTTEGPSKIEAETEKEEPIEDNPGITTGDLTYIETETTPNGIVYDVYADSNGNEYKFLPNGKLLSFYFNRTVDYMLHPENIPNRLTEINENTVVPFAEQFARKLFGNEFDGFTFKEVRRSGTYANYDVWYNLLVGKNDFINAGNCYVSIDYKRGNISHCVLYKHTYEMPNPEILESITKDEVVEYAAKEINSLLDNVDTMEFEETTLVERDGSFALRTSVYFTVNSVIPTDLYHDIYTNNEIDLIPAPDINSLDSYHIYIYYPLS